MDERGARKILRNPTTFQIGAMSSGRLDLTQNRTLYAATEYNKRISVPGPRLHAATHLSLFLPPKSMAISSSSTMYPAHAYKRRRTATSVLAGDFDTRPSRDVLTSVLNGVPIYEAVEKAELEQERRARKKEKKEREREREKEKEKKRAKSISKAPERQHIITSAVSAPVPSSSSATVKRPQPTPVSRANPSGISSFWQTRPTIQILANTRSTSITPPPMPSSQPSTPDRSMSSATSATSSKRPRTPSDGDDMTDRGNSASPPPDMPRPPRKKRQAARKGWKGWVEGSPPPSEKLINLDVVPVLGERRTRSGKNFDAIGVGKDSWV